MEIVDGNPQAPASRAGMFDGVVRCYPSLSKDHVCVVAFEYENAQGEGENPGIRMELPRALLSEHLEEFLLGLVAHRSIFSPAPLLHLD